MLRTSSYTIFVDLQGNDQDVLLVHGYTGAYDRVSRLLARLLSVSPESPSTVTMGSCATTATPRR